MVFGCLTWIPFIWGQLVGPFIVFSKKGRVRHLPDNVTIEILSKLPVDCVLECRRVCRNWRELTSSPYFAELHLQRGTAPPSLFFHWCDYYALDMDVESGFFIYDKDGQNETINRWWRKRRIITKLCSGREMYDTKAVVLGSCNGLLVFISTTRRNSVFVFNPITRELVNVPSQCVFTTPCGIYFHPLSREYKLLLCPYTRGNGLQCYYTYSLKSKVWKKLDYSSSCRTRGYPPAILLNGSLHWMVNRNEVNDDKGAFNHACTDGIMVFGTETEDFRVLPHPGEKCHYRPEEHENMILLGTRDHLCLCHVSWDKHIHVWVLKDYANWAWDRRYKVNLDWDVKRFPFSFEGFTDIKPAYEPRRVKLLSIENGELVISWDLRGIFTCNLKQNTVSKVEINAKTTISSVPYASVYTRSLVKVE